LKQREVDYSSHQNIKALSDDFLYALVATPERKKDAEKGKKKNW